MIAHWGSPDPAAVEGTEDEKYQSFVQVASQVAQRVDLFCAFSDEKLLDAAAVRQVGEEFKLSGEMEMKR
jgi:arsenate reductase